MAVDVASAAVLGAGRIGLLHAENIERAVPGMRVLTVADTDAGARERARARLGVDVTGDWQEAVADPRVDAVLVCSPTDLHAEQVRAAADAGKHTFCEKPLDTDLAAIDQLLAHVADRGVVLQVGFNRRFDPQFSGLRERIARGDVGPLWTLSVTSRDPEPPPPGYTSRAGGLFLDMTIHDFDMVRFLSGSEIVEVTATATSRDPASEQGEADTALTVLRLASGALAVIDNCRRSAHGYDQRAEAHGPRGTAFVGNVRPAVALADERGLRLASPPGSFLDRYREAYVAELGRFRAAMDGAEVEATGLDGRQAVAAALAAERSHDTGRAVRPDGVPSGAAPGTDDTRTQP